MYLDTKSAKLRFQQYDYDIKIEGPDRYKPGLSYRGLVSSDELHHILYIFYLYAHAHTHTHGSLWHISVTSQIVVEKLDGTPKVGLEVEIEINSWTSYYRAYSKTYTTDSSGRVKFGLPAIAGDTPNFSLRVG